MTEILLLGIFHFTPIADEFIFRDDIQQQLKKLNESLLKFNPDKIGIEAASHAQGDIDTSYIQFNLDDLLNIDKMKNQTLGTIQIYNDMYPIQYKNEAIQIGYRLGKTLNHNKIYAIDDDTILENEPWDKMSDYYRKLNDICLGKLNKQNKLDNIIEMIKWSNSDEHIYYDHHQYLNINSVNTNGTFNGSIYTANWYMRNLKIFSNIQKICESCDRLLVIIGDGHLAILRNLVQSCDNMKLININDYLTIK